MNSLQTVAITGASGLIGRALSNSLTGRGIDVVRFGRRPGGGDALWDPRAGTIDRDALRRCDAVVHLAGAGVADARWTERYRREIRESRTLGTALVSNALAALDDRPRALISASAIGLYGDTKDTFVDETGTQGAGFLAEVVEAWEAAAQPARDAGLRVVHPRFGIVLSPDGGALQKMLPPFRLGGGGPMGSGKQFMSWVAIDDAIAAIEFALNTSSLAGAINVTSPNPVTNAEFSETLGRVLHRPAVVRVPAFAIRAVFGAMGDEALLAGSRVIPRRLLDAGFSFAYRDLEAALTHLLAR